MKKTKKFAFLSLFSLLLTGCNSTGSASTGPSTGKQPSEAITEPREAPTVAPTEKPTESPTTAGGNSDTSGTESGSTGGTSTSTATQTLWKKSVASRMEKYFDGYIIPYVNIGNYDAEWIDNTSKSSTYLSILGSEFDASKMDGFKTTYLDDGWTQTKMAATDRVFEKGAFKVEITKDSDGYFLVKAYYDVVYDASKAPGAWDQDTLDEINAEFPNRSIPYLYLGAPVCYTKFASSTKILTIYGYKFDPAIITAARATFAAPDWTIEESSNINGPILKAKRVYPSGDVRNVTIATPAPTSSTRFSITLQSSENWDKDAVTDWPSALKQEFTRDCDGHTLTYFYLGTKYPTYTYLDSTYKFTITGGVHDARTIPNIKTTLEKDTTCDWAVTRNGNVLEATTTFSDGAGFIVRVPEPKSSTDKTVATVFYLPALTIPDTATDWDDDIKNERKAQFNQIIPYIYLGEKDLTYDYDNRYARRKINTSSNGTFATGNIITNAKKVLEADGWTVTLSVSASYGFDLVAEKTFDDTGDKRQVKISSTSTTGRCSLYVQRFEAFDDSYVGAWDTDRSGTNQTGADTSSTKHSMDENFGGHSFPYIYLGTKRHNSSWAKDSRCRTIYGGQWNEKIIAKAKASFEADAPAEGDSAWTITTNSDDDLSKATKLTAKKTFADGCTFEAVINKPSTGTTSTPVYTTQRSIFYADAWGAKKTDWDDKVKTEITKAGFPSSDLIPYVYLGTDDPTPSSTNNSTDHYVQLKGAKFDDRVLTEFDTSFTKAGWTINPEIKTRYGKDSHEAYKYVYDADGKVTAIRRAGINRWSNSDSAVASRRVFYDKVADASTAAPLAWSDANKTVRKQHLGGTDEAVLPELNIGSKVTVAYKSTNGGYVDIKTDKNSTFSYAYFNRENIKKTLEAAGWNASINVFTATGDPTAYADVKATKTTSDGTLTLTTSSTSKAVEVKVYYKETFAAPTGKDAAWDSDTIACFKDGRDGYTLPYFYLGSKTPILTKKTVSSTANEICTLTGSSWDDSIYTNRKAALQADTTITDWQFRNDYSKRALYGTIYVASGTRVVTTPAVYDDDGVTVVTPEKTETHYVTLRLYKDSKANGERPILEVYYF